MKTEELIGMLATGVEPVPRHAGERRLALAIPAGVLLSLAWILGQYGVRADLVNVVFTWPFGFKLAMPLTVALCASVVVFHLAHPGARVAARWIWGLGLPVALLWGWAAVVLVQADPAARMALVLGQTWRTCVFNIASTALPVGLALFWALRGLAPTRPVATGAIAGWMAGAIGAGVYALHCPEMSAPFLAVWYVLGMALCAAAGALAGRWALRW